ncbi:MAG: hypothetical protein ACR2JG_09060 [Geodermatophilaceae bacterium]
MQTREVGLRALSQGTGLGIGYVDAHMLAATMLTTGARLWTRDKRLAAIAAQRGLASGNR